MPLTKFDHVNVRTGKLAEMIEWYGDVLGLTEGFRPNFPFPGAWLYLGDQAIIHLVGTDPAPTPFAEDEDLRMEHFSFRATDYPAFQTKLDARGIESRVTKLDDIGLVLVNIRDPDGNHIHVDFEMSETD